MLKGSILFNALLGFWGFGSVTILVTFLKKTLKNLRKHSTIHCSVLKDRGQRILRIQGGGGWHKTTNSNSASTQLMSQGQQSQRDEKSRRQHEASCYPTGALIPAYLTTRVVF